ncbi:MAG: thymidine phosphorylase [Mycoplasma sp.]
MNILEIIEKKKKKIELNQEDINFFVKEYINGTNVKDYQASSLLMAMRLNGLSTNETFFLTKSFVDTSALFNFHKNNKNIFYIDKHSSGGVGDKVSIILLPILVSLGVNVPKISGRGLGHTGGTIDKLDSINVNTNLTFEEADKILNDVGCVIMAQNESLVPADKKLYALRDVTGTVDTPGLMTSSILSKKFVLNSDHIFIDMKVGSGALLNTFEEADELAKEFISISNMMNRQLTVSITSMDQPLGKCIGNLLEVKETVDFLTNKSDATDLKEIIDFFVGEILVELGLCKTTKDAQESISRVIEDGSAYKSFVNWINAQGGDINLINSWAPKYKYDIISNSSGFIKYKSTHEVGTISLLLGAGRKNKEDSIDMDAGIYLNKQFNDYVSEGELIATLYSNEKIDPELEDRFLNNIEFSNEKLNSNALVLKTYSTNSK